MRVTLLLLFCALMLPLYAAKDAESQQILERIKPIGNVRVEGKLITQTSDAPDTTNSQSTVKELPGKAIYESHCVVCHGDGIAGAPKFRDEIDWQSRLAKSNIDELLAIAIKGLNAMPPKGTCGECSDDDIKNAIQYMLPRK